MIRNSDVSETEQTEAAPPIYTSVSTLPDLPELESVESNPLVFVAASAAIWLLLSILTGAVLGAVYAIAKPYLTGKLPDMAEIGAVAGLCALLVAPLFLKLNVFECRYKTDSTGITVRGLSTGRSVPWSSVISAEMKGGSGSMVYRLRLDKGRVDIPVTMNTNGFLAASVWQHLRRLGKAGAIVPPPETLSIWTPIPDSVPRETDWNNPKQPMLDAKAVFVGLFIIVALIFVFSDSNGWLDRLFSHFGHALWGAVLFVYAGIRSRFLVARRVMVRSYRVEAHTELNKIDLDWDRVTVAHWAHNTYTIGTKGFGKVAAIPFDPNDSTTSDTILAIIRHLRNRHNSVPVPIPPPLQALPVLLHPVDASVPDKRLDGPVTWRNSVMVSVVSALVLLTTTIVFLSLAPFGPRGNTVFLMALPLLILGLLALATHKITLDDRGVTISRFWRNRTIEWWKVATYEVAYIEMLKSTTRSLKDGNGNVLFAFGPISEEDQAKHSVANYLDARLSKIQVEKYHSR